MGLATEDLTALSTSLGNMLGHPRRERVAPSDNMPDVEDLLEVGLLYRENAEDRPQPLQPRGPRWLPVPHF